MIAFILRLVGVLAAASGSVVGRVLIALGIGYVSYTGLDITLTALKSQVISQLGSAPATVIACLHLAKVDVVISILFSAMATRLIVSGLTSGAVTRMVLK